MRLRRRFKRRSKTHTNGFELPRLIFNFPLACRGSRCPPCLFSTLVKIVASPCPLCEGAFLMTRPPPRAWKNEAKTGHVPVEDIAIRASPPNIRSRPLSKSPSTTPERRSRHHPRGRILLRMGSNGGSDGGAMMTASKSRRQEQWRRRWFSSPLLRCGSIGRSDASLEVGSMIIDAFTENGGVTPLRQVQANFLIKSSLSKV